MMLKWKGVRHVVLLAAVVLAISSIFIYVNIRRTAPGEEEETGLSPSISPHYFMPLSGKEVSLAEAQASVPFKIQLPTNTGGRGRYVQVKLNQVPQENASWVFIIYSAEQLPTNVSRADIKDHDGILLAEAPLSQGWETLEVAEINIRAAIAESATGKAVSINGYLGYAGGDFEHVTMWATETTYYQLNANKNYPLSELIQVAQSIPVK